MLNKLKRNIDGLLMYVTLHAKLKKRDEIFKDIEIIEKEITKKNKNINILTKENSDLKEVISKKKKNIKVLIKEKENLQKELEILKDYKKKYEIIVKILKKNNENERIKNFKNIIYNELLPLINKVDVLPNEADIILKLQHLIDELEIVSVNENVFKKPIIAVSGGFSAGKSQFISSFLKKLTLPTGIDPTTAIPTYVVNGKEKLTGVNFKGGIIEFSGEEKCLLSHKFISMLEFNLREYLPYVVISSPFEKVKNICFIDTPGYNPTGAHTKEDVTITKSLLNEANSIIWLLGADSNGTISSSDIEFLDSINLEDKPLYVVVNKSDLKSEEDLEDILDEVEEVLNDYEIGYEGISAYSSIKREEVFYKKMSLFEFLKKHSDKKSLKYLKIKKDINTILNMYKDALKNKIKKYDDLIKKFNSISLSYLQYMGEVNQDIEEVKNEFVDEVKILKECLSIFKIITLKLNKLV